MLVRRGFLAMTLCAALAACTSEPVPDTGGDSGVDAGHDAGTDAGTHDGGSDAGTHDGGTDAGSDAGPPPGSPGAPTLSATSTFAPGAVHLSWTPADALATNFEVLRSTNQGAFAQVAEVSAGTTTYNDTALAVGNPYAYKVTAKDSAGTGLGSNVINVLGSPFDVAAGGSDTRLIVTWGPIEQADSYDVYRVPASGAPQLLANTVSNDYLDDGSVQPVAAGATYSYQVVAKSASGLVASIGSNVAQGTALGLDVTANQIFVSDSSDVSQSLAPSLVLQARNIDGGALLNDAGSPVVFQSVSNGTAIVVPGVPHGTYAITVNGYRDYAVSSARALDYSVATMGRRDVQRANPGTQIAYSLTGLTAWSTSADAGLIDALEEISLGAGNYSSNLAYDVANPPAAGQTTFAGTETLGGDYDTNLVSADAGDALYLFQLHAKTSSNGVAYLAPSAELPNHAITTVNGTGNSIAGALAATAAISIAGFDFPRSAWLDPSHATLNPAATNPKQRVYIEEEKGFTAHGWYSNDSLADGFILDVPQDGGTPESDGGVDVNVGNVAWADPVPSSWDSFALVQSTYDVPFQISFQDTGATPPTAATAKTTFTAYSSTTVPMTGTTFANSALSPMLSAPRTPQLGALSAFTAQTNLSATSTLSWTAPALGAPIYYLMVIYSIVPQTNDDGTFVKDAGGNYLVDLAERASFTTKSTSVSLAADLVPAGINYFATIDAVANANGAGPIDATVKPYTLGPNYTTAETVTALFTIKAPNARTSQAHALRGEAAPSPGRIWSRPGPLAKGGRMAPPLPKLDL